MPRALLRVRMPMALRHALSTLSFVLLLTPGCRDKATTVKPDPTAANTQKTAPSAAGGDEKPLDEDVVKATVTTNKIELPRAGHDPVVLELPVVKGLHDVKLEDKVNALITPEKILGESIDDVRAEVKTVVAGDPGYGIQGSGYQVTYADHGVLQIDAHSESFGAYPSISQLRALIDLRTGEAITGKSAFRAEKIPGLVARLDAMLKAEAKASDAMKDKDFADLVRDAKFETVDLDGMGVTDKGVTFHHDYAFPHVALALEPSGEYFVAWSDLAGDLDPKGPLARIHPVP